MVLRLYVFATMVIAAVIVSSCVGGSPAKAPDEAMAKPTPNADLMIEQEMSVSATSMPKPTAAETMEKAAPTPGALMGEEKPIVEDALSIPDAALPAWFFAELTDVTTGAVFTLRGLQGKVVLVENMAIWCPTCLRQQQQVQALNVTSGDRADLVTVTLDIDPNEEADELKAYVAKNNFHGLYAVAPAEVAREIGRQLGNQFLNPPSAPMFVIDREGRLHPLPFGVKSTQALADALQPFLTEEM